MEALEFAIARRGAATATDPAVAETLAMIARDEARHAELAWDILAWCVAHGGASCASAVASRRARLARSCRAPVAVRLSGDRLAGHGFFPQASSTRSPGAASRTRSTGSRPSWTMFSPDPPG